MNLENIKWWKPDTKGQILYDSTYMRRQLDSPIGSCNLFHYHMSYKVEKTWLYTHERMGVAKASLQEGSFPPKLVAQEKDMEQEDVSEMGQ